MLATIVEESLVVDLLKTRINRREAGCPDPDDRLDGYSNSLSPRSEAIASVGDSDCYNPSPNSLAFSRQAAGVNPVPTLLATMRHFSCS